MLGQMESVLGADSTIQSLCEDIVTHYEKYRANHFDGQGDDRGVFAPDCDEDLSKTSGAAPDMERKKSA